MFDLPRLARSFQTAPAAVAKENSAKYLESALTSSGFEVPDWFVPDLEDGTAPAKKAEALDNCLDALRTHTTAYPGEVWPRIEWDWNDDEIRERGREQARTFAREVPEHVDGVVIPKVGRVDDVERAIAMLEAAESDYGLDSGTIECCIIIETSRTRADLGKIASLAAETELAAIAFGPLDFAADLGARGSETPSRWDAVIEELSSEASANDLIAIGGVNDNIFRERAGVTVYNAGGYAKGVERDAAFGLDGSWSLHPKQTIQANHIHMPSEEELSSALRGLEAFEDATSSGTGAVTIDGQMIDEASARAFKSTISTVQQIEDGRPGQTNEMYRSGLLERVRALGDSLE